MKKKIMFFINTLAGGGAERVLVNLLKVFDLEKYDITVITVKGGENLKEIPPQVKVRQIIKSKNKLSVFLIKILYNIPRKLFATIFLRGNFDIEISYLPGFPTRILASKRSNPNTKKIAFIHGKITEQHMGTLLYRNTKECVEEYSQFSKVCFVSNDARDCFLTRVGSLDNSTVVYNVINYSEIKALAALPTNISYTTQGVKFVAVGRLVEVKGFERLLHAVKELKDLYDFELWILGKGPLYEKLNDYIIKNDLNNVHLLGYHDNPYKYIKQADYFVCSSFSEGYSTAAIESKILGVPVITTDCPGMREILETDKYGYIVENSQDGIRNGLEYVLKETDKTKTIINNVLEFSKEYTSDKELQGYIDLFN